VSSGQMRPSRSRLAASERRLPGPGRRPGSHRPA
jgi:hypothetical protein